MKIQNHFRNTMLAGLFAVLPIVVTIAVLIYVEHLTNDPLTRLIGFRIPGLGMLLCVVVIYLSGLIVTSVAGKLIVRLFDKLLTRIPLVKDLYAAWKQISYTPGGGEGIYGKVVLIPHETPTLKQIGFSTGTPLSEGGHVCVFVPNSPNPVTGRVVFVMEKDVVVLKMTVEEAFKLLLSSGNYVPSELVEMKA
jgi:uncharacterized membrane protein